MGDINVSLDIMIEAITNKEKLIKQMISLTIKQEKLIESEDIETISFYNILDKKDKLIKQIEEIDKGFQITYDRIKGIIKSQLELYSDKIEILQKKIKTISEYAIEIQVLEQKNRNKIQILFQNNKNKVKNFKQNRKVVTNYYKNMSNTHTNQSYFMDKRK